VLHLWRTRAWVLTGDRTNWRSALQSQGIWGVRAHLERDWTRLEPGDRVFFYCTAPVSAVIGFGTVQKKFRQDKPFWPDEMAASQVIYPFRFEFDVDFLLPEDQYEKQGAKRDEIPLKRHHYATGMTELRERGLVEGIQRLLAAPRRKAFQTRELTHDSVKKMIWEIGKLQRFVSDMEYPMERERLDVVWRRIEKSVPTYVFEVQVGGDVHHAIGKLKHARDLWNSEIFLTLSDKDEPKAVSLLSGTFHEIRDKVRLVKLEDVRKLYELKREWKDFESGLGILYA